MSLGIPVPAKLHKSASIPPRPPEWTSRPHREAGHLIGDLRSLPAGVKPLSAVLAEYVAFTEREVGRQALAAEHPALASILQALDDHSVPAAANVSGRLPPLARASGEPYPGARPTNPPLASRSQGLPATDAAALPAGHVQWVPQVPCAALAGGSGQLGPAAVGSRKRVSRRKRSAPAADAFSPQKRVAAPGGAPPHLLDMPLNEAGLVSLLSDPDFQVWLMTHRVYVLHSAEGSHERGLSLRV